MSVFPSVPPFENLNLKDYKSLDYKKINKKDISISREDQVYFRFWLRAFPQR